jgi:hypothetical protein
MNGDLRRSIATPPGFDRRRESPFTAVAPAGNYSVLALSLRSIPVNPSSAKVVPFPLDRRRTVQCCPHCGTYSDVWKIGRLLWGFCNQHEVRWIVADYKTAAQDTMNRQHLRKGLEFLARFAEISR